MKAESPPPAGLTDPMDVDTEAERAADMMLDLGKRLTDPDPAVLREVLRQFVSRIDCRWKQEPSKTGKQLRCKFLKGPSDYGRNPLTCDCGEVGHSSKHRPSPSCLRWSARPFSKVYHVPSGSASAGFGWPNSSQGQESARWQACVRRA